MAYLNRLTLIDSNGHVYDSVEDIGGDYHLGVAVMQDINQDPHNSSTANLASNATFTGTGTSLPGVGVINVTLKADQNCTVYVDQSGDGVNYDVTDTYYYVVSSVLTNVTFFGVPVQVVGQSYRVRVTNTGPSTTTVFRLESQLTPVGSPLPRTLDPYQNLKVGIYELSDQYGFSGSFDPQGKLAVEEPTRLVGNVFTTTTDTNFWNVANSGAGSGADTGTATPNWATLTSGTANSGYGKISSVRQSWFVAAVPLKFHSYMALPTVTVANTTRAWGALNLGTGVTIRDGFYFSVNGSGALSVNCANNGSVTSVASGSFNGLVSQVALDANQHHYDIVFGVFGAYFFMDSILIHYLKQTTAPLTSTFTLYASAYSANSASGTTSAVLETGMLAISRLGKLSTAPKSFYNAAITAGTLLKSGGLLHGLVVAAPGSATTVTLYDNTAASGTILWSATFPSGGNPSPVSVSLFDIPFYTGLELVANVATPLTVVYE